MSGDSTYGSAGAPKVVVVDDDASMLRIVERVLRRDGVRVATHVAPSAMLAALEAEDADAAVVLTDLHMPGVDGYGVLKRVKELRPDLPVIFITGGGTVESAVEAMKLGAYDYLLKPIEPIGILSATVKRALEYRRLVERNRILETKLAASARYEHIVGSSAGMREVFSLIDSVADVDVSVLILGESGTGKELVARAIHERSPRASKALLAVNCGALTESVLESELFGHVKGAFTGATEARRGLFEAASGSTLFLDEVAELPPAMQVKLLRAVQDGEIRPVGTSDTRRVDVRILAATHRNLEEAVASGKFRQDLYYRLNVLAIDVPPLRARPEDIPELAHHFIHKHAARLGRPVESLDSEALEALSRYTWPGNVRELENVIARAIVLAKGHAITSELLPTNVRHPEARAGAPTPDIADLPLAEARDAFESAYLERSLTRARGNIAEAARTSGLDPSNLRRTLKRHGIDGDSFRDGED